MPLRPESPRATPSCAHAIDRREPALPGPARNRQAAAGVPSGGGRHGTAWRRSLRVVAVALLPLLAQARPLPAEVRAALHQAGIAPGALAVVVQDVGSARNRLVWNDRRPVNPASVFKLFTTYAALDRLGPAWRWRTPVYLSGRLHDGVLDGSVAIRGSGDPTMVIERVWLLLRRLRQIGVTDIRGDILLDHGAFAPSDTSPAAFDGDPTRPYNVQPDALMLNFKSVTLGFTPDPDNGRAIVSAEPPLAGVHADASVPLADGPCGDWRSALKARLDDPTLLHFGGRYAARCGDQTWPVAYADAAHYDARLIAALWRELGGHLAGTVRDGAVPDGARLAFEAASPPLPEVVRDINKFSNNVMAEQLFLSLPAALDGMRGPVRNDDARETLRRWLAERFGDAAKSVVIDNGSGLSRQTRVTAELIAQLLQRAWAGPVMAELMSSLPVSGLDGTLRHASETPGLAHLKTGSLRDVVAVAGYVLSDSGRRYVLAAVINDPGAEAGRPALDALVQWTIHDAPAH